MHKDSKFIVSAKSLLWGTGLLLYVLLFLQHPQTKPLNIIFYTILMVCAVIIMILAIINLARIDK